MNLKITLAGLNHRTAGVDVRERFALNNFCEKDNWIFPAESDLRESLILSTCNRVEILGISAGDVTDRIVESWARARGEDKEELKRSLYVFEDREAVKHLFEVASSLDSMVVGEPQILGQLKNAYRKALEAGKTGAVMNRLLHGAFKTAKRARSETAIAARAVSVSYAAAELAKRIFGELRGHKAMLLGAGEMAELAAAHLLRAGIDKIIVVNRTLENGRYLADRFNGEARSFDNLADALKEVDIVIASTGSPKPVLGKESIEKALICRKNEPMFLIDIAVPRDIDPEINIMDNVYLYDIDDLKEVVEENVAARGDEAIKVRQIIDEEAGLFFRWLKNLDAQPTIKQLIRRGEDAVNAELAKTFKRLGALNQDQKLAIEVMAKSLARKLNHEPLRFIRESSPDADGVARIAMVRKVFNLDDGDVSG